MEVIKIDSNKVKMVAHRGLSGIEVENTIDAFNLASKHTYFGIETDIHVTLDGKYIVHHDDNLERICGVDMVIEETNYDDLRKVKVINKDGSFAKEMYLPSLEEYISICRDNKKISVLELKNQMKEENIIEIVNIVKNLNHYHNTIFISFSPENIVCLKKNFTDINTQFLSVVDTDEKKRDVLNFAIETKCDLDLHYGGITYEFVKDCHNNGIVLNVWTVDDPILAEELINMGVDFITSNILE